MITSASEFRRLRTSLLPEDYNRAAVESAPLPVWETLVSDYPEMRFWVAHNRTVPLSILQRLANDPDPRVRYRVASKRQLDAATLRSLATDADDSVRMAVAVNRRTPDSVLDLLTSDPWPDVADRARQRLSRESPES